MTMTHEIKIRHNGDMGGNGFAAGGCAAQTAAKVLAGSVHGSIYTSAEGGFSVPFPVSAEVERTDFDRRPANVTFTDNWGSRITFSGQAILEHSSMLPMLEKDGREKALSEFAKRQYGDLITVHYHPEAREGMISFIYLRPASPKPPWPSSFMAAGFSGRDRHAAGRAVAGARRRKVPTSSGNRGWKAGRWLWRNPSKPGERAL
jgi:hypothetical protein